MKGNDGTGNVVERDDWQTPQWLFDMINTQYEFEYDCCASRENSKCEWFESDFLKIVSNLQDSCWMNPPFSKAAEMFEHFFNIVEKGVCIYRCDNMETKIWQEIILKYATWVFIPKGRISYEGKVGKGSRFPSALIGVGVEPPVGFNGATLFLNKEKSDG